MAVVVDLPWVPAMAMPLLIADRRPRVSKAAGDGGNRAIRAGNDGTEVNKHVREPAHTGPTDTNEVYAPAGKGCEWSRGGITCFEGVQEILDRVDDGLGLNDEGHSSASLRDPSHVSACVKT
jgi:hypothetical protein